VEVRTVLSAEDNEILTRVGPGTPMGELLRRYWIPASLSSEIAEPDGPPARVRLLCEDLVAFRDTNGAVGLIEERCPHRGASLFYGRNEECGLRCTYHGWKFDVTGQCPSGYMSMKFWRHDPRALIEVDDTWHGFRYAGIRETPNGYRHARVTAYIFPTSTIIAQIPFSTRQIFVVPVDDVTTYRYNFTT
jgi:nitrite reductase/ring-hydroxylating ferredoxin subunit